MENKRRNALRWGIFLVSLSLFGFLIYTSVQRSTTQAEGGGDGCSGNVSNCQYLAQTECENDPVCDWATGEGSYCTDQALCSDLGETDCTNSSVCEWSGSSGGEGGTYSCVGDMEAYCNTFSDSGSCESFENLCAWDGEATCYAYTSCGDLDETGCLDYGHGGDACAWTDGSDTTGPVFSWTNKPSGDIADGNPLYSGSVTDAATNIYSVYYSIDGGDTIVIPASDGTYDETSEDFSLQLSGLSTGSHTINFTAQDYVGNTTSDSATINVLAPDDTAPTITFTESVDGLCPKRPTYAGTITDSQSNIQSLDAILDGTDTRVIYALDGSYDEQTEEFNYEDDMPAGTHTLVFRVVDAQSNSRDYTFNIDVDTEMPFCELSNHERETSDTIINYSASCSDNLELLSPAKVEYNVYHTSQGDITSPTWITIASPEDGAYDETEENFSFTTPSLPDGNITVSLRITDQAGNTNSENLAVDGLKVDAVDNSAPTAVLHDVRPDPNTSTQPTISGGCQDTHPNDTNTNITEMAIEVDSSGDWTVLTPLDGAYDEPIEEFSTQLSTLTQAEHTVTLRCKDSSGDSSDSTDSDTFTITSHNPSVSPDTTTIPEHFDNQVRNASNYENPGIWGNGIFRLKEEMEITSQQIVDSTNFGERYNDYNSWLDLHQAEDDTLWYTKKGGFAQYDPATDTVTNYALDDYGIDGDVAETKRIQTNTFDGNHYVWVATGHGLLILNTTNDSYVVYNNSEAGNVYNSGAHAGVHTLTIDQRGSRNAAYVTVVYANMTAGIESKILYIDTGTNHDLTDYTDDFSQWIPTAVGRPMAGADEVHFHPTDDNYVFMHLFGTGIAIIKDNNDPQNFAGYTNSNYTHVYLQEVTNWTVTKDRNINAITFFGEYAVVERDTSNPDEMDLSGDTVTLLADKDLLLQKSLNKLQYFSNDGVVGNQAFFITDDEFIYLSDNGTISDLVDDTIIFNDPNPVYYPNKLKDFIVYENTDPNQIVVYATMRRGLYKITFSRGWEDSNQGIGLADVSDPSYKIADHFKLDGLSFNPVDSPLDTTSASSVMGAAGTELNEQVQSEVSANSFEGVSFFVSVDDGITWTPTTLNEIHALGETDNRIRFRMALNELSGNRTPVIDLLNLQFSAYAAETQQEAVDIEIQTQPPSSVKVNNTFNFTVRAIDALGNTAVNYNEAGSLSLRLASATDSAVDALNLSNVQFVDGVAQVNAAQISQTGDYVIRVTSGAHSTTTNQIHVYDELAGDTEVLPKLSFWADKYRIKSGESVNLQWSSENLNTLEMSQGVGSVDLQGSRNVTLTQTTTFTLQGYGDYGDLQSSLTITVYDEDDDEACVLPEIEVDPEEIIFSPGERVALSWEIENAEYAYINYPEKQDLALMGSQQFYPEDEAVIVISAYNGNKENETENTCFTQKEIEMRYGTNLEQDMMDFTEGDLEDQGSGDNYQRSIVEGATFPPEAPLITAITLTAFTAGGIAWFSGIMQGLRYIGVLLGFLFPRKKKYWGIVFDENESKGIPFASVRLYKYKEKADGNGKLIESQAVTDEKGRYGLLVESGPGKYQIEVKASGYQGVTKQITLNSSIREKEIVEDFPLLKEGESRSFLRRLFLYRRQDLFKVMRLIMFVLMLGGFTYTLLITKDNPVPFNYALLVIYAILFALNLIIIVRGREKFTGRVVDKDTHQGIGGASLRVYKDSQQIKVELTNANGDLKMNIAEGEYKAIVNKRGYNAVNSNGEPISVVTIKVDKGGYILDDIYMLKSPELSDVSGKDKLKSIDSHQLQNPFSNA